MKDYKIYYDYIVDKNQFENAFNMDLVDIKCAGCETVFKRFKRNIIGSFRRRNCPKIYCTAVCASRHCSRNSSQKVICSTCGTEFLRHMYAIGTRNFCSRSCSAIYTNSHKKHGIRRSKLEKYIDEQIKTKYPNLEYICNTLHVLNGLELDFYFPSLKLAIEINGIFHYKPIYTIDKLNVIQERDKRKVEECYKNNIKLLVIDITQQKRFTPESSQLYINMVFGAIDSLI